VQREKKKRAEATSRVAARGHAALLKKCIALPLREKKQHGGIRTDNAAVDEGRRWGYFVRA